MTASWLVLKFGGTSVSCKENWQSIASILAENKTKKFRQLVVCSALCGVSNELENLISVAMSGKFENNLKKIVKKHEKLIAELDLKDGISVIQSEIDTMKRLATGISLLRHASAEVVPQVMALGELMSTKIGQAWLKEKLTQVSWLDAREYLVAEGPIKAAICKTGYNKELERKIGAKAGDIVITQGFIARCKKGRDSLLGRGGSDTSASYFASMLNAERVEIWTDVPGMFTTNPKEIPSARLLHHIDYDEAQELASSGASVLHPRSIEPLRNQKIPLHIRWTEHPKVAGTVVSSNDQQSNQNLKAIVSKKNIFLISIETTQMWMKSGFLSDVFDCFKRLDISVNLITTSQNNITLTLDSQYNTIDKDKIDQLIEALNKFGNTRFISPCASISFIGKGAKSRVFELDALEQLLGEKCVYMVSHAVSDINFTIVVDEKEAFRITRALHQEYFASTIHDLEMGPRWTDLNAKGETSKVRQKAWWEEKREELIELAEKNSPLYVYNPKTIKNNIAQLKSLKSVDKVFYAMKANCFFEVLKTVHKEGINFECVSIEEIRRIKQMFPSIPGKKLLFTPSFASFQEYKEAFSHETYVTIDNVNLLKDHPDVFKNQSVIVRVDPQIPQGHHKHVKTAGNQSKFGVPPEALDDLFEHAKKIGCNIIGLHAHVGSGVLQEDSWKTTALTLAKIGSKHPYIKILNLGGGLGVAEKPEHNPLNLSLVDQFLGEFKSAYPQYEIWLEPGRYIVAESGVLLAEVMQTKQKNHKHFVGLNVGMNSLIRPALYGSYHGAFNLSRFQDPFAVTADIVGPICETGDVLGYDRNLPDTKEGDIFLFANVGAYGHVMSSLYNLRSPAKEVWFESTKN